MTSAPVGARGDPQEPVGAEPGAPVAERDGLLRRHRVGAVEVEQDEEVVAQAVVLGQPHAA